MVKPSKVVLRMEITINALLHKVEQRSEHRVRTTKDFELLSEEILQQTRTRVSAATLKRLWGYVSDRRNPRLSTLDILAKFVGHASFESFSQSQKDSSTSEFFSPFTIESTDLRVGERVEIEWLPNRRVVFEYLGYNNYRIVDAHNSKLIVGDELSTTSFALQYPLVTSSVRRDGLQLPAFIAGKDGGLTKVATA